MHWAPASAESDSTAPREGLQAGRADPCGQAARQADAAHRQRQEGRARHRQIDTRVLDCTNLPPCAAALRAATGLPVLDGVTLLNARMAALG